MGQTLGKNLCSLIACSTPGCYLSRLRREEGPTPVEAFVPGPAYEEIDESDRLSQQWLG